jgi:hypothetical protein
VVPPARINDLNNPQMIGVIVIGNIQQRRAKKLAIEKYVNGGSAGTVRIDRRSSGNLLFFCKPKTPIALLPRKVQRRVKRAQNKI